MPRNTYGRPDHGQVTRHPGKIQGAWIMAKTEEYFFDVVDTPIGLLAIVVDDKGAMRQLSFDGEGERWQKEFTRRYPGIELVKRLDPFGHASALKAYFVGDM